MPGIDARLPRCRWASARGTSDLDVVYHDEEWGVASHDDRHLFEMLILEGAQAGLSWSTILKKREGYRRVFDGFDAERIARYSTDRIERMLTDASIVRNRLKVHSAVTNAQSFLATCEKHGSFDAYIWKFVDGSPIVNNWRSHDEVPATTTLSDAMSKQMKKDGFKFVGSTICYAYMQAVGMVNDHTADCFRWRECADMVV